MNTTSNREALTFMKLGHLGVSSRDDDRDQRVARDQRGNWYLYDWSGVAPDLTDDGPLRITLAHPFEVRRDYCSVRVVSVRAGQLYRVGATHAGLVKLIGIMRRAGETVIPEISFDAEDFGLRSIVDLWNLKRQSPATLSAVVP